MGRDSFVEDNLQQLFEAFEDRGWKVVLDGVSDKGYRALSDALHEAAVEVDSEVSRAHWKVLMLLAQACSMMLVPEDSNDPYQPWFVGGGRRSTIPDDFTGAEIAFFAEIVESMDDLLLKGRLADLVWLRQLPRDVRFALAAIESYTQLPLDVDTWFSGGRESWQRAIGLTRMIGNTAGDRLGKIESSIVEVIQSATAEEGLLALQLADTLRSSGLAKSCSSEVADKLESLAVEFRARCDFHASESCYYAAGAWFKDSGDNDSSIDMIVAEAETFVADAASRVSSDHPSYAAAAIFLESAIQAYRRIPRAYRNRHQVDQRIQDLGLRLNEYHQRALQEMTTMNAPPIDLSESIDQARSAVSGKPPHEALRAFANVYRTNVKKLRQSAMESLSRSFSAIFPKVVMSHDGRVVAKIPGVRGHPPSEDEEAAIRGEMNHPHYTTLVGIAVQALILPALDVLTLEHRLRTADFIELARRSPIVPIGREVLFGKALAQGFNRDFATSIHLLAPQIEHMVRFHLKSAGVLTAHLDQEGLETENGLSALIELPETLGIFGEDLTYEIGALFCDKTGPNLRNNIAHGLLSDREAQSVDAVYAWWLGLKLVFNTFYNSLHRQSEEKQQGESYGGVPIQG